MYDFEYNKPKTVPEAGKLIESGDEYKLLAGGMSLIPSLKLRLARYTGLVDLGAINDLRFIRREGDVISIGAMTQHAVVAASPEVASAIPALSVLAGGIGDPMVRNRGTIGGSIANSDPAADYPGAVVGLGATIQTSRRSIAGDDYFRGLFETALEPGEIITAVHFPIPKKAGYTKLRHPASRFAIVGVMVAQSAKGVRVGVTGAGQCAFRFTAAEAALERKFDVASLEGLTLDADGLNSDIHASAEYRAHCVVVMTKRALLAALSTAS